MVQGGMSSIAEAKASPRSCREASANTNSRRAAGLVTDTLTGNYESDQVLDPLGCLAQQRVGVRPWRRTIHHGGEGHDEFHGHEAARLRHESERGRNPRTGERVSENARLASPLDKARVAKGVPSC